MLLQTEASRFFQKGSGRMSAAKRWTLVMCGMAMALPSFGGASESILIIFDERADTDIRDATDPIQGQGLTNPGTHVSSPMVSIGGDAHYGDPWAVYTAWNPTSTNGPGNELQEFAGTGTITLDQVPPLPAGEYHVFLSFNVANWNNGSPVGIQMGGTGVTEAGNELPGSMHFIYPESNTGQDTLNLVEIAGPHMGPGSGNLYFQDGSPATLVSCTAFPFPCAHIPTGSNTNIFNDGNSFPTSVFLAPGNEFILSMRDGAGGAFSHLRGFSMTFCKVGEFPLDPVETDIAANRVVFDTLAGVDYGVQCTLDPTNSGAWMDTGNVIAGTGAAVYYFDPTGAEESKAYRVVMIE